MPRNTNLSFVTSAVTSKILSNACRRTNRWTGATGNDFRIKRDPARLLGSAVARSTQSLSFSLFDNRQ